MSSFSEREALPPEGLRKGFKELVGEVISPGVCSGCAACVLICPYHVLKYEEGRPQQKATSPSPSDHCVIDERWGCGACALVCPRLDLSLKEMEKEVFGRSRLPEEEFGVFRRVVAARSTDERVLEVCQDGGVVTTLLAWMIKRGIVDGAVVSSVGGKPCDPVPKLATTYKELLESAGSWYTYCPNPLGLKEAKQRGLRRVAFVGVPCQIEAIRRMQALSFRKAILPREGRGDRHWQRVIDSLRDYEQLVDLTVGLFCSECFTYEGLMAEKIERELGLELKEIVKVNIKGRVLVHQRSGIMVEVPLEEVELYARPECQYCGDFSAELADISVGGIGTEGWTLTVLRTGKGEQLFDRVVEEGHLVARPIEEFPKSLRLILRFSQRQRRRAIEAYQRIN